MVGCMRSMGEFWERQIRLKNSQEEFWRIFVFYYHPH
jgi:hypothetical protein